MPLLIVKLAPTGEEIVINMAHVVLARRTAPPVSEVTMVTGVTFTIALSLPDLLAAGNAVPAPSTTLPAAPLPL